LLKIALIKQEARRQKPRQHRAGWDVEYLLQTWRLAVLEARGRESDAPADNRID
jgi:hypothetical protein